ncbi:MAG: hypothetical protein ACJ0QC_00265 [Flavobacteriales bacterium]
MGFPYTGWQNHSFPIPAPAQINGVQFRWIQTNASGVTWDFWGIDNVAIYELYKFSIHMVWAWSKWVYGRFYSSFASG